MISADDARALMNRKLYEEKVKQYEQKIEKHIIQAAKNNHLNVMMTLTDDYPLFEKVLSEVLQNFADHGFEVIYAWVDFNKYAVSIVWQ